MTKISPEENDATLAVMKKNYRVSILRHPTSHHTIKFYEMVHIAPQSFYDFRNEELKKDIADGFVVHHEGVKNVPEMDGNLMEGYQMIAQALGWEAQKKPDYPFKQVDIAWEEMSFIPRQIVLKLSGFTHWLGKKLMEAREEEDLKLIDEIKASLLAGEGKKPTFASKLIGSFLLTKRNKIAIEGALSASDNVSLVWGAAHAPGIIKGFSEAGYELRKD